MDRELIKLIEENGLTLHGDIEFFAHLVAEREREACAAICDAEADEFGGGSDAFYAAKNCATAIRARGGE